MMRPDAKILVLGHRGLIGSALMRRLQHRGFDKVTGASRAEADLEQAPEVIGLMAKTTPDYVFLCAGKVGGITQNQITPADFIFSNLAIQSNVLQQAQASGVKKLILFGSSCMYPRETQQPMAESAILTGALEPTSLPYALSKLAGLQMCFALNKQYGGQRFMAVIPNSVYGPYDNFDPDSGHVLSALIHKIHMAKSRNEPAVTIWGSGTPRREFIHADDVADACIHLMQADRASEGPFNLGTGSDVAIMELAQMIARVIGYRGQLVCDPSKPDGTPRKLLDSGRIRQLGWSPEVTLEQGLEQTYQWYLAHHHQGGRA